MPTYGEDRPSYGEDRPSYGEDRPSYGEDRPSYGADRPDPGQGGSRYGGEKPGPGAAARVTVVARRPTDPKALRPHHRNADVRPGCSSPWC
jgi:hypothetical protein